MKLAYLWNFSYFTVIDKIKDKVMQASEKGKWGRKKTAAVYMLALFAFIWGVIFSGQQLINFLVPEPANFIFYGGFMIGWCLWLGLSMLAETIRIRKKFEAEMKEGYKKNAAEDLAIANGEKPAAQPQTESA